MADEILEVQAEFIPVLTYLCRKFYEQTSQDGDYCLDAITDYWRQVVASGLGVCYVAIHDKQPVGFICGFKVFKPENMTWVAIENHWYVEPSHRGRGIYLLKRFEKWALEQGCSEINVGETYGIAPKNLGEAYRRMGYAEYQKIWLKKLKAGGK